MDLRDILSLDIVGVRVVEGGVLWDRLLLLVLLGVDHPQLDLVREVLFLVLQALLDCQASLPLQLRLGQVRVHTKDWSPRSEALSWRGTLALDYNEVVLLHLIACSRFVRGLPGEPGRALVRSTHAAVREIVVASEARCSAKLGVLEDEVLVGGRLNDGDWVAAVLGGDAHLWCLDDEDLAH